MRHLIAVAANHPSYRYWCQRMRISERVARYFSPHTNPYTVRGLDGGNVAIVWVDDVRLPLDHACILDIYKAQGATEIGRADSSAVRKWLDADADEPLKAREVR